MTKHTMNPINWNEVEDRIRPHVKILRDAGFETIGSCGHDMWITIDCAPARIHDLETTLRDRGYRDFEITYTVHAGFHDWRNVTVKFGGDLKGDSKPFDLVLLKVDPDAHPLYFVIKARRWPSREADPDSDRYYYDEHTCPTNWTDDIVAVVSQGDEDPHGFATFVTRKRAPENMTEDGDLSGEGPLWTSLFPEMATEP